MRLNKKLAKKIIGNVNKENKFFCSNGEVFSNLNNLKKGLEKMDNKTFLHHTKKGKNDFSNWIKECIEDVRLADGLIGLNKKSSSKKIESRIAYIERYLEKKA